MFLHMSCRFLIVLLEQSSCVPAGAGGEVVELALARGGTRMLEHGVRLRSIVLGATAARCLGKQGREGAPHTVVLWC